MISVVCIQPQEPTPRIGACSTARLLSPPIFPLLKGDVQFEARRPRRADHNGKESDAQPATAYWPISSATQSILFVYADATNGLTKLGGKVECLLVPVAGKK